MRHATRHKAPKTKGQPVRLSPGLEVVNRLDDFPDLHRGADAVDDFLHRLVGYGAHVDTIITFFCMDIEEQHIVQMQRG